ncbi:sec-independent translocase [Nocardioides marinus]|uniref:Sec-independent protein translocase protein TatB n=1 Tax=Nocardioides marinus TaxID=374514 RepID=A0A7Y9YBS7_9ACTN|nr:sec-independent translocase [uncultured Nocardioides sp.]NYI09303.1 sec-independent protein translocase protein TatB [Nocardioides marinus]
MWGVGLSELAVIAFVAVLVFGPERIPVLAKQAGQWIKVARRFAHQARDELRNELGPEYADLELRDLDPRTVVRKHIIEAMNDAENDDEDDDDRSSRRGRRKQRPLDEGEVPPYDLDAT